MILNKNSIIKANFSLSLKLLYAFLIGFLFLLIWFLFQVDDYFINDPFIILFRNDYISEYFSGMFGFLLWLLLIYKFVQLSSDVKLSFIKSIIIGFISLIIAFRIVGLDDIIKLLPKAVLRNITPQISMMTIVLYVQLLVHWNDVLTKPIIPLIGSLLNLLLIIIVGYFGKPTSLPFMILALPLIWMNMLFFFSKEIKGSIKSDKNTVIGLLIIITLNSFAFLIGMNT